MDGFQQQPLPAWRRAVLKVGSSLLTGPDGTLDDRHAAGLAAFLVRARADGREVVVVSSGAVAAGRGLLPVAAQGLVRRQALAAVGQAPMVAHWQRLLDAPVAQVLLSHDDLRNRRRYLNARGTLRELLGLGVVPVVNENDTVATEELRLGDNDNLAAAVAALVDASLLLIATDVPGLYSGHPGRDPSARPIARLATIGPAELAMAGGAGGPLGTGGMRTKLEAAAKAAAAGTATALFCGRDAAVVAGLAEGRLVGTLVDAGATPLQARKRWLRHVPLAGRLVVDAGAVAALSRRGASLLPGGVVAAEGGFLRGDPVEVIGPDRSAVARGLVAYAAADLARIAGRPSREIDAVLGYSFGEAVIHRDDLVLVSVPLPEV